MKLTTPYRSLLAASAAAFALGFAPLADAGNYGGRNQSGAQFHRVLKANAGSVNFTRTITRAQPTQVSVAPRQTTARAAVLNRGHHVGRGVASNAVRYRTAKSDFSFAKLFGGEG